MVFFCESRVSIVSILTVIMANNTIRLLSVFLLLLPLIGANSLNPTKERAGDGFAKSELLAVRDNTGIDTAALNLIIYLTLVNSQNLQFYSLYKKNMIELIPLQASILIPIVLPILVFIPAFIFALVTN